MFEEVRTLDLIVDKNLACGINVHKNVENGISSQVRQKYVKVKMMSKYSAGWLQNIKKGL